MAFWGFEVKPKKEAPLLLERRLVIKQAALVVGKGGSSEPCVLSVSVGGGEQQFVVCRLHEGRAEHCTLELPFSPEDRAVLHLKGPHAVHLTGFLDLGDEDNFDEMDEEKAAARGFGGGSDSDEDSGEESDESYQEGEESDDDDDDEESGEEDDEAPTPPRRLPSRRRAARNTSRAPPL